MKFLMIFMFASALMVLFVLTLFTRAILVEFAAARQVGSERLTRHRNSAGKRVL